MYLCSVLYRYVLIYLKRCYAFWLVRIALVDYRLCFSFVRDYYLLSSIIIFATIDLTYRVFQKKLLTFKMKLITLEIWGQKAQFRCFGDAGNYIYFFVSQQQLNLACQAHVFHFNKVLTI